MTGPTVAYNGNLKRCPGQLLTFARHRARVQPKACIFMSKYLNVIKPKQQTAKEHNLITQKAGFDFEFSAPPSCVLELSNTERMAPASLPFLALSRILKEPCIHVLLLT